MEMGVLAGMGEWGKRPWTSDRVRDDAREWGARPFSVSLRLDRRVYSRGGLPQGMGELRGVGRRCFAQSPMRVGPPVKPEGYGFFGAGGGEAYSSLSAMTMPSRSA